MYHSLKFFSPTEASFQTEDINTWDDWHLIPTSRPVVNPPAPKTNYVDLPGASGSLDLSDALTKYPIYENREGSFEFIVANDRWSDWQTAYTTIMSYIHNRRKRMILEDDPEYYYEGRFSVNNWTSNNDGTWSNITIDYTIDPYKRPISGNESETFTVDNTNSFVVWSFSTNIGRMPVCPTFTFTPNGSNTWSLKLINPELDINETNEFDSIAPFQDQRYILSNLSGSNPQVLSVKGSGTLTMSYLNGEL